MRLKVSFEGHQSDQDNIIVVHSPDGFDRQKAKDLLAVVKKAFPGCYVVILPSGSYLEEYKKKEYIEFLEKQKEYIKKKMEEEV